ncbi:MAG: FAD-binding oxidoreductase [Rhodospirillaceae bacterium]|jgi:FAD/FMN-containing dehydrogenase|nr:FAD-binding oxidoreductase [Rhodospirillaceae bacterium]
MTNNTEALNAIREAVGPKGWVDAADEVEPYVTETRGLWRGKCDLVVSPASTKETAAVVRICADGEIPIVAMGGNTGLVGGGLPNGGIVLATHRMNMVRDIDPVDNTMTVEAGCILADLQTAAESVDRLFPLSLGAEGSCRIGGNLSTNAGGVQVLRYGNTRDLVLGIEAVLPDGRIWNDLTRLRKDNTGYDMKHLLIGGEGTLGVITAAVLKLFPRPRRTETAFVGAASPEAILALFTRANTALGNMLSGFEYASQFAAQVSFDHMEGVSNPLSGVYPAYGLIEVSNLADDDTARDALEAVLADALEDEVIVDAVVAQSETQSAAIWKIRESIPESQREEGASIKHDVAVPVSRVAEFIREANKRIIKELPGTRPCAFGHMGDGNIHYNLTQPPEMDGQAFMDEWGRFKKIVHNLVADMDGSFSAEHGIGTLKRDDLATYKQDVAIDMMRTIKNALDPKNIMNPGKVLPD